MYAFLLCAASNLYAEKDDDLYLIKEIAVAREDDDSRNAKTLANQEAMDLAFQKLLSRLGALADVPAAEDLALLVRSYQVGDEKVSRTSYRGTYAVQFDPELVEKYFQEKKILYLKSWQPPTVVIPLLASAKGTFVFEEENNWFQAWQTTLPFSISPLILPEGDADDLCCGSDLLHQESLNNGLKNFLDRYPGQQVALMKLQPEAKKLVVSLYDHQQTLLMERDITLVEIGSFEAQEAQALKQSVEVLNEWFIKTKNAEKGRELPKALEIEVNYASFGQVLPLCQSLGEKEQGPKIFLTLLSSKKALFAVKHHRDLPEIKGFFSDKGFNLERVNDRWIAEAKSALKQVSSKEEASMQMKTEQAAYMRAKHQNQRLEDDVAGEAPQVDLSAKNREMTYGAESSLGEDAPPKGSPTKKSASTTVFQPSREEEIQMAEAYQFEPYED